MEMDMRRHAAWILSLALSVASLASPASAQEIEPNDECLMAQDLGATNALRTVEGRLLRASNSVTDVDFFRVSRASKVRFRADSLNPAIIVGEFSEDCRLTSTNGSDFEVGRSTAFIALALSPDFEFKGRGRVLANGLPYRFQLMPSGDNGQLVGQFVQARQVPGQRTRASAAIRNVGSTTWTPAGNYTLMNASPGAVPPFGFTTVPLPAGTAIAPGQTLSLEFDITAPSVPGMYDFGVQIAKDRQFFGAVPPSVLVLVDSAFADNAILTEQFVQNPQSRGTMTRASVAMRNDGTTTWTAAAGYALVNISGGSPFFARLPIQDGLSIPPGERASFNFDVSAPVQPGTYEFQVQMAQGNRLFGNPGPVVRVTVQ
jgi:hypothetical protein